MDAGLRPVQVGEVALTERMEPDVTRCSHWARRGICLQDAGHGERYGQWPQDGAKATRWSRGSPGKEDKELPGEYLFYKDSCYPNCPPPGVLQTELWGGGKKDNFLFLETFFDLETGWKNPVKTQ